MAGSLAAAELTLATDSEKLKVRDAQIAARMALIRLQQLQADPVYRKVLADVEAAQANEQEALADLARRLNCAPDPATLACRPETKP